MDDAAHVLCSPRFKWSQSQSHRIWRADLQVKAKAVHEQVESMRITVEPLQMIPRYLKISQDIPGGLRSCLQLWAFERCDGSSLFCNVVMLTQDTAYVQDMLLDYASGIASEISKARDKLRKSGGNMTDSAQDETWLKLSKFVRVANTSPVAAWVVDGIFSVWCLERSKQVTK